jgi:hypothetical protein
VRVRGPGLIAVVTAFALLLPSAASAADAGPTVAGPIDRIRTLVTDTLASAGERLDALVDGTGEAGDGLGTRIGGAISTGAGATLRTAARGVTVVQAWDTVAGTHQLVTDLPTAARDLALAASDSGNDRIDTLVVTGRTIGERTPPVTALRDDVLFVVNRPDPMRRASPVGLGAPPPPPPPAPPVTSDEQPEEAPVRRRPGLLTDPPRAVLDDAPRTGPEAQPPIERPGPPAWSGRLPAAGVPYADAIEVVAARYDLDGRLLAALVWSESGFRPGAISTAGAVGLAQLMPGTARSLGVDPYDPLQNLDGGARYLRDQLDRFGRIDLALAAYNAGPGRVAEAGNRIPDIRETRRYVEVVLSRYRHLASL